MSQPYFTPDQLLAVGDAVLIAGLVTSRDALLAGVYPKFRYQLPNASSPLSQVRTDLDAMNAMGVTADDNLPMEVWLKNALANSASKEATDVFERARQQLAARLAGQPLPTNMPGAFRPPDPRRLPETKEVIVHQDDTLPFGFLEGALRAGAAVAKVIVTRSNDGRPAFGTCGLLAKDLVITNHHVVAARDLDFEPPATPGEVASQARGARVQFAFDAAGAAGRSLAVREIAAASDDALDFVLLRLEGDAGVDPLRLRAGDPPAGGSPWPPVNIIQHPDGEPKRIAIRNNLLTDSSGDDLRYFTDTRSGSSGSPVFDDRWQMIGLHRGATAVDGVSFQGKKTAWVNVGTRLSAIVARLRAQHPELARELAI